MARLRVAVHKFSSCDGCQLAFLNAGEALLALAEAVELVHFAEAGLQDEEARVDVAFVEGSVSTLEEIERLHRIRAQSRYLVALGACAGSGGLQALRNLADGREWLARTYPHPEWLDALPRAVALREHVPVDLELPGCPVSGRAALEAVAAFLWGAPPERPRQKVCLDCRRRGLACVLVSRGEPCLGPVTEAGCGALCPASGRGCYGCYGPAERPATAALAARLRELGLDPEALARLFLSIHSAAPGFREEGLRWRQAACEARLPPAEARDGGGREGS